MTATLETITQQAIQLPARQRLALAGFLLEMNEADADSDAALAWESELQDRIQAVDSGAAMGVCYSDVLREVDQRLAP